MHFCSHWRVFVLSCTLCALLFVERPRNHVRKVIHCSPPPFTFVRRIILRAGRHHVLCLLSDFRRTLRTLGSRTTRSIQFVRVCRRIFAFYLFLRNASNFRFVVAGRD